MRALQPRAAAVGWRRSSGRPPSRPCVQRPPGPARAVSVLAADQRAGARHHDGQTTRVLRVRTALGLLEADVAREQAVAVAPVLLADRQPRRVRTSARPPAFAQRYSALSPAALIFAIRASAPAGVDWRRADIRIAGIGGFLGGVGAVHGPTKGGPATGRNPTVREGASASPKGLKARSPVCQRAGPPAPRPARARFGLRQAGRRVGSGAPPGGRRGADHPPARRRDGIGSGPRGALRVSGALCSVRCGGGAVSCAPDGAAHSRAGHAEEFLEFADGVLANAVELDEGGLLASGWSLGCLPRSRPLAWRRACPRACARG